MFILNEFNIIACGLGLSYTYRMLIYDRFFGITLSGESILYLVEMQR